MVAFASGSASERYRESRLSAPDIINIMSMEHDKHDKQHLRRHGRVNTQYSVLTDNLADNHCDDGLMSMTSLGVLGGVL